MRSKKNFLIESISRVKICRPFGIRCICSVFESVDNDGNRIHGKIYVVGKYTCTRRTVKKNLLLCALSQKGAVMLCKYTLTVLMSPSSYRFQNENVTVVLHNNNNNNK